MKSSLLIEFLHDLCQGGSIDVLELHETKKVKVDLDEAVEGDGGIFTEERAR